MIVCQTSSAMAIMLGKYSAVIACRPHQMISRMRDISPATGLDWMTITVVQGLKCNSMSQEVDYLGICSICVDYRPTVKSGACWGHSDVID
jgi:hypothetical protein